MKMKESLAKHLVDSTAVATVSNTVMAPLETLVCGMPNEVSANARMLGTALTFAGLGTVYTKGRDLSKRVFKITEKTSEKVKAIHDTLYSVGYLMAITPAFYYASGSRDLKEIAAGTIATAAVGLLAGSPTGYAIDAYRDLTGIQESERLPDCIKKQDSKVKKGLVALITAGSVAAITALYSLNQ